MWRVGFRVAARGDDENAKKAEISA
jgi:hypothetical protein